MKRLSFIFFFTLMLIPLLGQTKKCKLYDEKLEDDLSREVYQAITDENMTDYLFCDKDNYKMLYYMKNRDDLQVGFFYNTEKFEDNCYSLKMDFVDKVKKIYDRVKGLYNKSPEINFRFYIITNDGTSHALGSIKYNKKGKPWTFVNKKNCSTIHGEHNIFSFAGSELISSKGINKFGDYTYTSEIIN